MQLPNYFKKYRNMPRIFKGSESTLRLLISKTGDYQALTEIKIKLYTTDIENAIEIIDGIQVCKNIAIITLAPRAFMGMEDGLINYIIDGATEDDVFHTERQSNYMLKSLSYINEDGVATQTMTIESNGEYRVTPNDGLYVDINVNVPDLNGSYDDGFNVGYGQGKTDGVNEQKSKLETINITQNGTYTKEDGYNHIEVNVLPKINLQKTGLKLSYSTFTEVPEWVDFDGVTDMSNMFSYCFSLQTIPHIDTSNVSKVRGMFSFCSNLKTLPNNFNLGACNDMYGCFSNASITDYSFLETWVINPNANMDAMINNTNTTYVPAIPCVGDATNQQSAIFWVSYDLSKLTYFGGWIGRKYNVNKDRILNKMPNLTYESCISILNNLYDFTGNGEIPNSEQGKLKVHANFLTTVGEEISIGTSKGWTITV